MKPQCKLPHRKSDRADREKSERESEREREKERARVESHHDDEQVRYSNLKAYTDYEHIVEYLSSREGERG